jgi:hypothetical protein
MTIHISPTAAAYPSPAMFACSQLRMPTLPKCRRTKRKQNRRLSNGFRIGMLPSNRIHSQGFFEACALRALIDAAIA